MPGPAARWDALELKDTRCLMHCFDQLFALAEASLPNAVRRS
ncbi:hypothetical protein XHC_0608 [Xanthomonas hortorum pv. carotae str. M081]|nr:hypothetical protein XHC_0608 [Xanthomonas hortorum pv. carotae str. M081]